MEASQWAALVTLAESGAPRARTMDPFPPERLEVVNYRAGVAGDSVTLGVPAVQFDRS